MSVTWLGCQCSEPFKLVTCMYSVLAPLLSPPFSCQFFPRQSSTSTLTRIDSCPTFHVPPPGQLSLTSKVLLYSSAQLFKFRHEVYFYRLRRCPCPVSLLIFNKHLHHHRCHTSRSTKDSSTPKTKSILNLDVFRPERLKDLDDDALDDDALDVAFHSIHQFVRSHNFLSTIQIIPQAVIISTVPR